MSSRHFGAPRTLGPCANGGDRSSRPWSILQPLGLTLLLGVVLGRLFKIDFSSYAPYILSGIVAWDFVIGTATGGALAFVQADAYIRQTRHPLAIYTLRTTLANLIVLGVASLSLYLWVLLSMPANFGWSWLASLTVYPILGLTAWPLATLLAYISTRFRDAPHALTLLFQALWFVSPVYFDTRMFRDAGLDVLVDFNPIYHLLQIVRAPLLSGTWPTFANFAWCAATIGVLALLAWLVGRRAEARTILICELEPHLPTRALALLVGGVPERSLKSLLSGRSGRARARASPTSTR